MDAFGVNPRVARKITDVIHRCIEACADAEKGYALAAGAARDPELRAMFQAESSRRRTFTPELRDLLDSIGSAADAGGSALGAIHRAAVDVLLAVSRANDRVLLEECDRGERTAQRAYEVARSELTRIAAPKPLRDVVDAQYAAVCDARYELGRRIAAAAPPSKR